MNCMMCVIIRKDIDDERCICVILLMLENMYMGSDIDMKILNVTKKKERKKRTMNQIAGIILHDFILHYDIVHISKL